VLLQQHSTDNKEHHPQLSVTLENEADDGRGNSAGNAVGSNLAETLTVDEDAGTEADDDDDNG